MHPLHESADTLIALLLTYSYTRLNVSLFLFGSINAGMEIQAFAVLVEQEIGPSTRSAPGVSTVPGEWIHPGSAVRGSTSVSLGCSDMSAKGAQQ